MIRGTKLSIIIEKHCSWHLLNMLFSFSFLLLLQSYLYFLFILISFSTYLKKIINRNFWKLYNTLHPWILSWNKLLSYGKFPSYFLLSHVMRLLINHITIQKQQFYQGNIKRGKMIDITAKVLYTPQVTTNKRNIVLISWNHLLCIPKL